MNRFARLASIPLVAFNICGLHIPHAEAADMMAVSVVQPNGSKKMMKLNLDQPVSELRETLVNRGLDITPHDKIFLEEKGELSPRDEKEWKIREVMADNVLMFKPRRTSFYQMLAVSSSDQPNTDVIEITEGHYPVMYVNLDFAKCFDQNALLDQVLPYVPILRTLILKNCTVLDNSKLLKQFFIGQLVDLNLQGCTNVDHGIIKTLAHKMPGLERLNLSTVPKLRWIADAGIFSYGPILFKQLSILNLSDCEALEAIHIQAPKLKYLWIDRDKKLTFFEVEAAGLQTLSCEESSLTDGMIYDLFVQTPKVQLNLKDCPNMIYEKFLNGALIYRPIKDSDEGMLTLPIRKLPNPLEGTFDLSQCGNTGKYLSISMGYRKGRNLENKRKIEIWIVPRFLIEKKIDTTATHFQFIMSSWKQEDPVGIFWTWGDWDDMSQYEYFTSAALDLLSLNNNLLALYLRKAIKIEPYSFLDDLMERPDRFFSFSFGSC